MKLRCSVRLKQNKMCFKVKLALNLVKNNSQCQCHTFTVLKKNFEKEEKEGMRKWETLGI